MQTSRRERLLNALERLIESSASPSARGKRRTESRFSEGVAYALIDEAADQFDDFCESLLREEGWTEKFSEKYIRNEVHKLLGELLKSESQGRAAESFEQLIRHFEAYAVEHRVYVPVAGIRMGLESFALGRVILRGREDLIPSLLQYLEEVVARSPHTEEEKEAIIRTQGDRLRDELSEEVCAEYTVVAEPERARERAEEETLRALDLLRYATAAIYDDTWRVCVALGGDVSRSVRVVPLLSADPKTLRLDNRVVGPVRPFDLDQANVDHMVGIGVFDAAKILAKPVDELTDFERTLLRGIHWFGSAQTQNEPENRFLNFITCLETFLTPRDASPIGTAVAEGVAILIGSGVENRKRLKKRVKDLYKLRSGISHGGQKAFLESDLAELKLIAGGLTMTLIRRRNDFHSQKDLFDWLESQKFSAV